MDVDFEEKDRIRAKIDKLKASKFKQQTISSWRPKPTGKSTVLTFAIFGVLFLGIGALLFLLSNQIFEVSVQYDEVCKEYLQGAKKGPCVVELEEIDSDIKGPLYVYYQIDNYYQNHRRYVKSRDYYQLSGVYKKVEKLGDCDPVITVGDLWPYQKKSVSGKALKDTDPAIPCGLIAKSLFNDTFALKGDSGPIKIEETNIAWTSDLKYKFKNIQDPPEGAKWQDIQWKDMTDGTYTLIFITLIYNYFTEHFVVWMRTAGLPNFRKLWGRIEGGLPEGKYKIEIDNQFEVTPFQGKKHFVLATSNSLGGKNYFLAVSYFVVGGLSMFFAFIFCVANLRNSGSE